MTRSVLYKGHTEDVPKSSASLKIIDEYRIRFLVLSMHCKISSIELNDSKHLTCMSKTQPPIDTLALSKYSWSVGVYPLWYHFASNNHV